MNPPTPHYLLFLQSRDGPTGSWGFTLRSDNGAKHLEVADREPGVQGQRLELLTVVRGLEALDQPSKVTLMTPSKYVREGIRYGLPEWRINGWRWESYGEMIPVKNRDLWQRVDRAMRYHELDCRTWRLDCPHGEPVPAGNRPASAKNGEAGQTAERGGPGRQFLRWLERIAALIRRGSGWPSRWREALVPGS